MSCACCLYVSCCNHAGHGLYDLTHEMHGSYIMSCYRVHAVQHDTHGLLG